MLINIAFVICILLLISNTNSRTYNMLGMKMLIIAIVNGGQYQLLLLHSISGLGQVFRGSV